MHRLTILQNELDYTQSSYSLPKNSSAGKDGEGKRNYLQRSISNQSHTNRASEYQGRATNDSGFGDQTPYSSDLSIAVSDTTTATPAKSTSEKATKEILRIIKSQASGCRSSSFDIVDVNFEESKQIVELRYCLKSEYDDFKNDLTEFLAELKLRCQSHGYRLRTVPLEEIPFFELTRKAGLGSKIATWDHEYDIKGRINSCAGAFVEVKGCGVHILTTAHDLSVGQDIWFNSDSTKEKMNRGSLGMVKESLLVHEFEDYPETTDGALVKLSLSLWDDVNSTVNIAGEEKGLSYSIADAEEGRLVVKVCNQQSLLKGEIITTNYSHIMEPECYGCIVMQHYLDDGVFHVPGESGMLVAYEATPPLANTMKGVGMLIARYQENQKWFSVAVPLQRTLDRLQNSSYLQGRSLSIVSSPFLNINTCRYDIPEQLLIGSEFSQGFLEDNDLQNIPIQIISSESSRTEQIENPWSTDSQLHPEESDESDIEKENGSTSAEGAREITEIITDSEYNESQIDLTIEPSEENDNETGVDDNANKSDLLIIESACETLEENNIETLEESNMHTSGNRNTEIFRMNEIESSENYRIDAPKQINNKTSANSNTEALEDDTTEAHEEDSIETYNDVNIEIPGNININIMSSADDDNATILEVTDSESQSGNNEETLSKIFIQSNESSDSDVLTNGDYKSREESSSETFVYKTSLLLERNSSLIKRKTFPKENHVDTQVGTDEVSLTVNKCKKPSKQLSDVNSNNNHTANGYNNSKYVKYSDSSFTDDTPAKMPKSLLQNENHTDFAPDNTPEPEVTPITVLGTLPEIYVRDCTERPEEPAGLSLLCRRIFCCCSCSE